MDWVAAARRLETKVDFDRFSPRILKRFSESEMLYVACSGGADSVFALLCAWLFSQRQSGVPRIEALHYDHSLRGSESKADAVFVRGLCADLGVSLLSGKAQWSVEPEQVTEAMARESRLRFFRDATRAQADESRSIVTGHHGDDVAETQLMRLSRGAGVDGLCAPREVSSPGGGIVFLRPLLDFSREEIQELLSFAGAQWREDSSNRSEKNYRARLRNTVIPAWEQAADRLIGVGARRSRMLLEEDAEALRRWAESEWEKYSNPEDLGIPVAEFKTLPAAIQRRLLQKLSGCGTASAAAVEQVLRDLAAGKQSCIELGPGLKLEIDEKFARCQRAAPSEAALDWPAFSLPLGCKAYLPDGSWVAADHFSGDFSFFEKVRKGENDDNKSAYLNDLGNLGNRVLVRRKQPGDAFKPLGKSSGKKLKTLLIERKVARRERDRLPVFTCENLGILWMPGLPPSADCKLASDAEAALRLTYGR